jgi:protease-4
MRFLGKLLYNPNIGNGKEVAMHPRKKRQGGFFILCLAVALLSGTASGCAFVNLSLFRAAQPLEEKVIEGQGPGKVLLMDISGVLSYQEEEKRGSLKEEINLVARVKEELDKASKDKEVKALILRIHSPGGTVNASDLLYHEIAQYKEKRKVRVVACLLGLATSGGYYVATAADYIIAQPSTLTGSIGTIALKFNVRGLMEKVGVEEESVKSGDKKDMWSPFRPVTPEERRIFQEIIDEYQGGFLEVVRAGRRELTETDLAIVGDGRVLTGQQALELHLVDQLGYLDDAVKWARDSVGLEQAKVVTYYRPGTYVANMYSRSKGEPYSWLGRSEQGGLFLQGPTPQFMYLWLP